MSLQHELQPATEELRTPIAPDSTAAAAASPAQMQTQDAWRARELARGEETRPQRPRRSLERKLRGAVGFQKFGKWACFATGIVWNFAFPALLVVNLGGGNSTGVNVSAGLLLMLQPIWAFVYLVGTLRCFLVREAARRRRVELSPWHPILRRWLVMGETTPAPAATARFIAPLPGTSTAHSAGAQLDASLARDRQQREQRERSMQRRLDAACRLEHWGRNGCLWAAYCAFFFCVTLISASSVALLKGVSLFIAIVSGVGGTVGLSLATLAVLGGKLRQHLLVKRACAEALEVVRVNDSRGPKS